MIRNREKFITIATGVTMFCCVLTLWTSSGVIYRVREDHSRDTQTFGETSHSRPNVLSVAQEAGPRGPSAKGEAREGWLTYDTWSAAGAMDILVRYNRELNKNRKPITVDPTNISTVTEWWQAVALSSWYLNSPLRYKCKQNLTWFGGWAVCQDKPYTVEAPCLVYSFGIAYDFTFDDDVANIGCDVRSFDPSMINISSHQRSTNTWFYRYGLYDRNTDSFKPDFDEYVTKTQTWSMRTLKHIVTELGHFGRTIDILKVDIESTEWAVFDNLIETDMLKYVRHLLVEYHYFPNRPAKKDFVHFFQIHTRLRQLGFREYYNRPHSEFLIPDAYRHQGESFYVNVNFRPGNK